MSDSPLGGRPRIDFTEDQWKMIRQACQIQCTAEEIASMLECSVDTLERRIAELYECGFADYKKRHSGKGKMSLRRKQYETAMAGNVTMQIWLGKQYLDQREKNDHNHGGQSDNPLTTRVENVIIDPKNRDS